MIGSSSAGWACSRRVLERHRAGDLERHLRGVDRVVRAVVERARARPSSGSPRPRRCASPPTIALLDRGDEAGGDHAALDRVHELEARRRPAAARSRCGSRRTGRGRRSASCSGRAPCALPLIVSRYGTRGGFRFTSAPKRSFMPLDDHLDVDLRQAGDDLLAGLRVAVEVDRRVLLLEAAQRRDRPSPRRPSPWARSRTPSPAPGSGGSASVIVRSAPRPARRRRASP